MTDLDSHRAMLRHGLKTGIAAVLAFALADLLHLKYGYWASLSSVIVMQVYVADSVQMCLYRFIGTAVGAVIGMIAILVFPATQFWTVLGLFCAVAFCAYMTRYNDRYRMASITVCIVIMASLHEDNRLAFSLLRVVEIGIGVASAFVISILLWPVRAGTTLREKLRDRFDECAKGYEIIMNAFLSMQSRVDPDLLSNLQKGLESDRLLLRKVQRHERRMYHEDTDLLDLKVRTLEKCTAHLQTMLEALNSEQSRGYEIIMEDELHMLADVTVDCMRSIATGNPVSTRLLTETLASAEDRLHTLRRDGATRRFYLQKLIQFFAFYHSAQAMGRDIVLYSVQLKPIEE